MFDCLIWCFSSESMSVTYRAYRGPSGLKKQERNPRKYDNDCRPFQTAKNEGSTRVHVSFISYHLS